MRFFHRKKEEEKSDRIQSESKGDVVDDDGPSPKAITRLFVCADCGASTLVKVFDGEKLMPGTYVSQGKPCSKCGSRMTRARKDLVEYKLSDFPVGEDDKKKKEREN